MRTTVAIDHLLSCPLPLHGGWRISTKRTFLPREHFSSQASHFLKTAEHGRGRAVYCYDHGLEDEVVAGLSYHIDDRRSLPVFITTIAFHIDFAGNAHLRYRTVAGAFVLKQYVHAVSDQIGRGGYVDIDLPPHVDDRYARELGFRNAPRLKGLRPGGRHMRQPALPDQRSGAGG